MKMIGREKELDTLCRYLGNSIDHHGQVVIVSGETGIGKTTLIEELATISEDKGIRLLSGKGAKEKASNYMVFTSALPGLEKDISSDMNFMNFSRVFLMDVQGSLLADAGAVEMDSNTIAGMLSVVGGFVKDSFEAPGDDDRGLGRIDYGDMTILVEYGIQHSLAVVFSGCEHDSMRARLKQSLADLDNGADQNTLIEELAGTRFLVKRDLEGIRPEAERMKVADNILTRLVEIAQSGPALLVLEDLHWADIGSLKVLEYLARNVLDLPLLVLCSARRNESDIFEKSFEVMANVGTCLELALEPFDEESVASTIETMFPGNTFASTFTEQMAKDCGGNPLYLVEGLRQMEQDGLIISGEEGFELARGDISVPASIEELVIRRVESLETDMLSTIEFAACLGKEFDKSIILENSLIKAPEAAISGLVDSGILATYNGRASFVHSIFQEVIYGSIEPRWKSNFHKTIGLHFETKFQDDIESVLYDLARHFSNTGEGKRAFDYCVRAAEKAGNDLALELAIRFYNDALEFVGHSADPIAQEKEILSSLGKTYYITGQGDYSVASFTRLSELADGKEEKSLAEYMIARAYGYMGQYDTCFEHGSRALEYLAGEESVLTAQIYGVLFWYYRARNELDPARVLLLKGLAIAEKLENKTVEAMCNHNLGTLEQFAANYQQSIRYLEKAMTIYKEIGTERGYHGSLSNLSNVRYSLGQTEKALEGYLECLEYFNRSGYKHGSASLYSNIGIMYSEIKDHEKAIENYKESNRIAKMIGVTTLTINNNNGIAASYLELGESDKAIEYANRSLETAEGLEEKMKLGWVHLTIGTIHTAREEWEGAMENYQLARKYSEQMKDREHLAKIDYETGLLHSKKGETEKARDHFKKALEYFESVESKNWVERISAAIGALEES